MPSSEKIKKILIPRVDTIGDIVLFEPFLRSLHAVFPEAKITFLVREQYGQLAPLFSFPLRWWTIGINPYLQHIDPTSVKNILSRLETEHWDLILFTKFEWTWFEYLIGLWFKDVQKISIHPIEEFPEWLRPYLQALGIHSESLYDEIVSVDERSHESEKYQVLLNYLAGVNKPLPLPRLSVPDSFKKESVTILQSLKLFEGNFCVCLPGGVENIAIKKWSSDKYAKVINWLKDKRQIDTILIGHESECHIIEEVAHLSSTQKYQPAIWLGKQGELPILAGILEQAKFYFGNDSGPMHMSGAMGIPVVGLFGGGTWPRFLPKGSESHVVMRPMPCYYCHWKCVFEDAPCIKELPIPLVHKALQSLLEKDGPRQSGMSIYKAPAYSKMTERFIRKAEDNFKKLEVDREARLEVIYDREQKIGEMNRELEERLRRIGELERGLGQTEADLENDKRALEDLKGRLEEGEKERVVQLEVIREGEQKIGEMNRGLEERLRRIGELERRLGQTEAENTFIAHQLGDIKERLKIESTNRLEQIQIIHEQRKRLEVQRAELIKLSLVYKNYFIDRG